MLLGLVCFVLVFVILVVGDVVVVEYVCELVM